MIGLEFIRKLNGDTTVTLAEKLSVTNALISQWENQKKPIPNKRLEKLSEIYDIPKEYFSRELTRLEQLKIERKKMSEEYDKTVVDYYEDAVDTNGNIIENVHFQTGDDGIMLCIRSLDSEIQEEKLIKLIRETIGNSYSDSSYYDEDFDSFIEKKYMDMRLISKFIKLMKNNTSMFLVYVLKAIEISDLNYSDEWGETPASKNTLVKQLAEVLKEYRLKKKQEEDEAYLEYKELFGESGD